MIGDDVIEDLDTFLQTHRDLYGPSVKHLSPEQRAATEGLLDVLGADRLSGGGLAHLVQALQKAHEADKGKPEDEESCVSLAVRAITYEVAWSTVQELYGADDRLVFLTMLARPEVATPRGDAFFSRVYHSYLCGFAPECVVMCRAVIESELAAEISTDDCIQVLGARRQPNYDLCDRIAVARKQERLSFEGAKAANEVRELGNRVVHRDPGNVGLDDAKRAIYSSLQVICELDKTRRR